MKIIAFVSLFISIHCWSHGGKLIQSGKRKGCHFSKKEKDYHCHAERQKQEVVSKDKASDGGLSRYNRKLYPHWIDRDGDCQNERQELLIGRSLVPVIFKKNRKGKSCTVSSGTWRDFYFDDVITEASLVDVDHIIPLRYAHGLGAQYWSKDKRRAFANDPENLVLTHRSHNRQKGARSPLEWLPSQKSYACKYFARWILVKKKYQLKLSQREVDEFEKMKCYLLKS